MPTFQDKLCNVLTFVGLLAVIGFGTAALLPAAAPEAPAFAPVEEEEALPLTEEIDELPAAVDAPKVDDASAVEAPMLADTATLPTPVAAQSTHPADSLHTAPAAHKAPTPEKAHTATDVHTNHAPATPEAPTKAVEQHSTTDANIME